MSDLLKAPASGHYKQCAIEPVEYIEVNNLNFHEGSIIKYVTRWRQKNGVEDLKKARWYIDRLISLAGQEGMV